MPQRTGGKCRLRVYLMDDINVRSVRMSTTKSVLESYMRDLYVLEQICYPPTVESFLQNYIKEYELDVADVGDSWMVFGCTYDSRDCLWNLCSSRQEAELWLEKTLQMDGKWKDLLTTDHFIICQTQPDNILS